jgi:uncharacterized Zn finger protein
MNESGNHTRLICPACHEVNFEVLTEKFSDGIILKCSECGDLTEVSVVEGELEFGQD